MFRSTFEQRAGRTGMGSGPPPKRNDVKRVKSSKDNQAGSIQRRFSERGGAGQKRGGASQAKTLLEGMGDCLDALNLAGRR